MGLIDRARSLFLGRSAPAPGSATALASDSSPVLPDAPPEVGALTKRVHGMPAGGWSLAQAQAEKWFGPYNPRYVPDWVLKIMGTDWTLGFAREIWLSAFHAVDYRVEGGDPEIRAFVDDCVERHRWQWIEAMLQSLDYGRQACELVWSVEDVAYQYARPAPGGQEAGAVEADVVNGTRVGAYVLGELRDLDPEATEILASGTGDYRGLRYQGVELPGAKTLLVTNEPKHGGLLGRSLHVGAYNPWWWGNLVYLGLNRYLERKGDPPLIGFAPGEEVADAAGNTQDPVRVTAIGLSNLRSGSAYVFPQQYDPDSKQPLYAVRALEVANRAPEFLETIDRYEHNKRLAWMIPGSLGAGAGASFASDKVSQQLIHRMFDRRLQRLILDPLNKHVIPKLVRFNFGKVAAGAYPRLAAGSMAENARELFAEILRAASSLETVLPDGRRAKIIECIDMYKGLRTLNLPRVEPAMIPSAPAAPTAQAGPGYPTAGRPPAIAQESDRPNAPGRPGMPSLGRSLVLAAKVTPDEKAAAEKWIETAVSGLDRLDKVIWKTEDLAEAERASLEAEIRNLLKKSIARAKTTEGADGADALHSSNRTLAADLGRKIEGVLEQSMEEDLLDEAEITDKALGLAAARGPQSPLAMQHAAAFKTGSEILASLGIPQPRRANGGRIVKDVVRDARSNGRGVVTRETRRAVEAVDRLVIGNAPVETAEAVVDKYRLPDRDFVASTVHHVRATARATLTWQGAQDDAAAWLVAAGEPSAKEVRERFPTGQVAEILWTVKTTKELDDLYHGLIVDQDRPVTSWRNLGLTFGSPEMYVPVPRGILAAVAGIAAALRKKWNEARGVRQEEIDERERAAADATPAA